MQRGIHCISHTNSIQTSLLIWKGTPRRPYGTCNHHGRRLYAATSSLATMERTFSTTTQAKGVFQLLSYFNEKAFSRLKYRIMFNGVENQWIHQLNERRFDRDHVDSILEQIPAILKNHKRFMMKVQLLRGIKFSIGMKLSIYLIHKLKEEHSTMVDLS